eukprot:3453261-Rhodomonas_salina.1
MGKSLGGEEIPPFLLWFLLRPVPLFLWFRMLWAGRSANEFLHPRFQWVSLIPTPSMGNRAISWSEAQISQTSRSLKGRRVVVHEGWTRVTAARVVRGPSEAAKRSVGPVMNVFGQGRRIQ